MNATDQKLSELCKSVKISSKYGEARKPWDQLDKWQQEAHQYRVTLRYKGRQMSLDFFMGPALKEEPGAAGVLSCLLSESVALERDFEEWCGDYGYDTDSRKAERIYKECVKSGERLKKLLGEDYELFLYAENDI